MYETSESEKEPFECQLEICIKGKTMLYTAYVPYETVQIQEIIAKSKGVSGIELIIQVLFESVAQLP